jgi:NDP-sugar pyrophosphorylase family protein
MRIIIPMTGKSSRFKKAGIILPKQFLKVKNKLIIEHILDMFPDEDDINLIANNEQLNDPNLKSYFQKLEKYKITAIDFQDKGPGGALLATGLLETNEQIFINYCDFANIWNWQKIKDTIKKEDPDGLIPAYSGLHPHNLYGNNYAFLKVNESHVEDIKEKVPFTEDKTQELASTGGYYFKSGNLAKEYIIKVFEENLLVNNEVYISTPYELMINDKLKVITHKINYFFQWGTPEDYSEFKYSLQEVENIDTNSKISLSGINLIIPAAGSGKRFQDENYKIPKIVLPVRGEPLIKNILNSFHNQLSTKILVNKNDEVVKKELLKKNNGYDVISLSEKTKDQSESAMRLIDEIDNDHPILIHSADVILDKSLRFNFNNYDVVVFTKECYRRASHGYKNYGWVNSKNDVISDFSIKTKPNNSNSTVITGIFLFKNKKVYKDLYESTRKKQNGSGEMHIDYMIETAIMENMKVIEVKSKKTTMLGTPLEYELFNYMAFVSDYLESKK